MLERPCFPAALTCPPRAQVRDPIALIVSSFLYHSNPKNSRTSSYEHWLRVPHTERHDATESVCNKALGGDSRGLGCPLQFEYELPLGTLALLEGDFEAPAIASVPNHTQYAAPLIEAARADAQMNGARLRRNESYGSYLRRVTACHLSCLSPLFLGFSHPGI